MRRASGILLHVTSLPSRFGIGDMGPAAYRFADFLAEARQHVWQILPLNPTDPIHRNSPYHSLSAFAGSPLLLSFEVLADWGLLDRGDLEPVPDFPADRVAYEAVIAYKNKLLAKALERAAKNSRGEDFERFCGETASWLEDFALFKALKSRFEERAWAEWPEEMRERKPEALAAAGRELQDRVVKEKLLQFLFLRQWMALKQYCNHRGIQIIGDIPIYVHYDSADVWRSPELFKLGADRKPTVVAGVPPDYFSSTGQLWGNPIYRWDILKERGYYWWMQRMEHSLKLFDCLRLDHFRGFVGFWEVPASEKTAVNGRWVQGPGVDFFERLKERFPSLPFIAEDLGTITDDVRDVIRRFNFPGMKLLLFAFGGDLLSNPYAPHNHAHNAVVYTGTHDNNTCR
jgi:4-alpha-glucanotransferase